MTSTIGRGAIPTWSLGDRLRKAREHADLKQEELADELDVARRTVGAYESGTTVPRRPILIAWALRTGVDLVWLMGDSAAEPRRRGKARVPSDSGMYFHGNTSSHTRPPGHPADTRPGHRKRRDVA